MWLKRFTEQELEAIRNELLQWESEEYVQEISEEEIMKTEKEGRGY